MWFPLPIDSTDTTPKFFADGRDAKSNARLTWKSGSAERYIHEQQYRTLPDRGDRCATRRPQAAAARDRWPERECVDDWSQGLPLAYAQEVARYWLEKYDWRAREARLNRFAQFRTTIDGLGIHFVHVRSPHADALPLVMTHGWPGSIVEFQKVIEPLTNPTAFGGDAADAFHLVCPTLPGYGYSDKPARNGWSVQRIASAWSELMPRLGYTRYAAQGGDWGSMVTTAIGIQDPAHCAGIHLNMPIALPDPATMSDLTEKEKSAIAGMQHYNDWDSGYSKEQSTRPQTVGYGLTDSPAGQLTWILEKFWSWTDCDGNPENVLTRDELLDNVMLYWLPAAAASSARLLGKLSPSADRPGDSQGRLLDLSQGNFPHVKAMGRKAIRQPRIFQRADQRRPLRRLRATGDIRQRSPQLFQIDAVIG